MWWGLPKLGYPYWGPLISILTLWCLHQGPLFKETTVSLEPRFSDVSDDSGLRKGYLGFRV